MRIEERTKRFWAGVPVISLFMLLGFYLYISPHWCSGRNIDCSHITLLNGTVRTIPAGELAISAPSAPTAAFFMFFTGVIVFMCLSVWVLNKAISRSEGSDSPDVQP